MHVYNFGHRCRLREVYNNNMLYTYTYVCIKQKVLKSKRHTRPFDLSVISINVMSKSIINSKLNKYDNKKNTKVII